MGRWEVVGNKNRALKHFSHEYSRIVTKVPQPTEKEFPLKEITSQIISCAIEVHSIFRVHGDIRESQIYGNTVDLLRNIFFNDSGIFFM